MAIEKVDMTIKFTWDKTSTSRFTSSLLSLVKSKEIEFSFEAKNGSIVSTFLLGYAAGVTSNITTHVVIDLLERVRRKALKKQLELEIPLVEVNNQPINYINFVQENFRETDDSIIGAIKTPKIISYEQKIEEYIKSANSEQLVKISRLVEEEINKRPKRF